MSKVTLDTNVLPATEVLSAGRAHGDVFAVATVTEREIGTHRVSVALQDVETRVTELGVWNESRWGSANWADVEDANLLSAILEIISNGSYPSHHTSLSAGQRRQLRDAMILEAHTRAGRQIFITNDLRGFVLHGKREALQALCRTKIETAEEYLRRHKTTA